MRLAYVVGVLAAILFVLQAPSVLGGPSTIGDVIGSLMGSTVLAMFLVGVWWVLRATLAKVGLWSTGGGDET